ncbi:uncharacterized protein LOC129578740 [Sitodiplosis mosellana]|uniref:uncharacterized protein LOC129578740 n=1 Tax=Sitodiplosis mosellana TaxID=263140 RepID=UPI0024437839|nr:uncharacterized protein LOC129578740 [Sitodiplosis mosellana]
MGDKSKKLCQGKDTFERMNFLYQAASQIIPKSKALSCYYGAQCKLISKKSLQRMEPEMKRTICKQCGLMLRPGVSAELSIQDEHRDDVNSCLIKCNKCNATKRYVVNPKYNGWLDAQESVAEVLKPNETTDKKQ